MINKLYDKIKKFLKENYKFLIAMVLLIVLFYYEFPYVIYKSGGTINLDNRVIIDKEYKEEGSLSMSYVTAMKGTLPFILLSYVLPDWDLVKVEDIIDNGNYDEAMEISKEYLNEGIDNAIIAAFKASDYSVTIKNEKYPIIYLGDQAKTNLKIGDEIISINDQKISKVDELKEYVNTLSQGDKVNIKVVHDGKEYQRYAYLYEDTDKTLKIGAAFNTTYDYETEIPVSVKMKSNESGSSGGLMMALAIYNALTDEDITKGLNIVGTGAINSDGTVEEIDGVKYKILGANKINADIFFCPEEN